MAKRTTTYSKPKNNFSTSAIVTQPTDIPDIDKIVELFRIDGLNAMECKVMAVDSLPQLVNTSVIDKCKLLDITQGYWYKIMSNPKYQAAVVTKCRELMVHSAWKLFCAYFTLATTGKGGDRQALERLLTQIGILDKENNQPMTIVNVAVVEKERSGNLKRGLNVFDREPVIVE